MAIEALRVLDGSIDQRNETGNMAMRKTTVGAAISITMTFFHRIINKILVTM